MRRLYRVRGGGIIGGVCAGIAEYFGVDPAIVRLAWAATIFLGGTGILAYLLAWIIIPEVPRPSEQQPGLAGPAAQPAARAPIDPAPPVQAQAGAAPASGTDPGGVATSGATVAAMGGRAARDARAGGSGARSFGVLLIILGAFWLAHNLAPQLRWHRFWPLALVVVGLMMVVGALAGGGRGDN
jgi:phage shock protein PspC (stress-responsive transcriptional regulator)